MPPNNKPTTKDKSVDKDLKKSNNNNNKTTNKNNNNPVKGPNMAPPVQTATTPTMADDKSKPISPKTTSNLNDNESTGSTASGSLCEVVVLFKADSASSICEPQAKSKSPDDPSQSPPAKSPEQAIQN